MSGACAPQPVSVIAEKVGKTELKQVGPTQWHVTLHHEYDTTTAEPLREHLLATPPIASAIVYSYPHRPVVLCQLTFGRPMFQEEFLDWWEHVLRNMIRTFTDTRRRLVKLRHEEQRLLSEIVGSPVGLGVVASESIGTSGAAVRSKRGEEVPETDRLSMEASKEGKVPVSGAGSVPVSVAVPASVGGAAKESKGKGEPRIAVAAPHACSQCGLCTTGIESKKLVPERLVHIYPRKNQFEVRVQSVGSFSAMELVIRGCEAMMWKSSQLLVSLQSLRDPLSLSPTPVPFVAPASASTSTSYSASRPGPPKAGGVPVSSSLGASSSSHSSM
jgi:hypothetical protein